MYPYLICVSPGGSSNIISPTGGTTTSPFEYATKPASISAEKFIVATEAGILFQMMQENPDKEIIPAPAEEDNTCACSECAFMKMNTLKKLYLCLKYELPNIEVDAELAKKAIVPIERMLELSK